MRVYKEKQYLVFDFEDGRTVKYDFATKQSIGIKGKPVKDLCSQLSNYSINDICNSCTDVQYGKFLRFVKRHGDFYSRGISNIGTILNRVPYFSHFEQLYSAGIDEIVDEKFRYQIGDIPKGLIRLCKEHKVKLSNKFLEFYKMNPDAYLLAYNLEYISLTDDDIYKILSHEGFKKVYYGTRNWEYNRVYISNFNTLITEYGYNVKSLLSYLDYLKTFEAMDEMDYLLTELLDYCRMMKELSNKFEKYPKHFLTTFRIATRNYHRLQKEFEEEKFKARINKDYEYGYEGYKFIYPMSTQDIKDEASAQNNCVASYIDSVINGDCHILFLRKKDALDKSLVTIEVRNNRIVQAKRRYNYPVTQEEQQAIDAWNNKFKNYEKEKVA